jgi:hypothetical protein
LSSMCHARHHLQGSRWRPSRRPSRLPPGRRLA